MTCTWSASSCLSKLNCRFITSWAEPVVSLRSSALPCVIGRVARVRSMVDSPSLPFLAQWCVGRLSFPISSPHSSIFSSQTVASRCFLHHGVPPSAVGIHIACDYCAASLSDGSVPIELPCPSLSSLYVSWVVNIHNPHHLCSSSLYVGHLDIVVRAPAQDCPFVRCNAISLSHRPPNSLPSSNFILWVTDSDSPFFPRRLLQKYQVCLSIHSRLQRSHGPHV